MNLEQNKFLRFQINPSFMKFQKNKKEKENEIMKRIKKIASLLLAMVMAFAMSVTAFAGSVNQDTIEKDERRFSITIDNKVDGYEYAAYQIFSGKYANGILSDIVWGSGVNFKDTFPADKDTQFDGKTAKEIAAMLNDQNKDADVAKAFAAAVGDYLGTAAAKTNTVVENTGYVLGTGDNKLTPGYYLVENTKVPESINGEPVDDTAYTRYILEVVGDVKTEPKSSVPTSDKKIVDDTNGDGATEDVPENEASIGDTVNYKITGTMPSTLGDYKTYYYVFNDTLSKGLKVGNGSAKLNGDTSITVEVQNPGAESVDVSSYFYRSVSAYNDKTGTAIKVGIKDIKALNTIKKDLITKDSIIVVTYSAVLCENANIGTANTNDVILDYSNDPNHSGDGEPEKPKEEPEEPTTNHPTGTTPKKVVETFTTQLTITKKIGGTNNVLPGAEFTLTGDSVNIVLITNEVFTAVSEGTEPEDGVQVYYKLKNGTYTTAAPQEEVKDENGNVTVKDNLADYDQTVLYQKYTKEVVLTPIESTEGVNVKGVIGTDGTVTFTGLGKGDNYKIEETKVPDGYNKCDDVVFNITFDYTKKVFGTSQTNENGTVTVPHPTVTLGTNGLETTIENFKGSTLPSTGGIGTTIFYVVGGILVIGAGILLVTKRRMKAQ